MKVIIDFTKEEECYVVRVNGAKMAYVYKCNNGKDVRVDDVAVYDSFIMPKADIKTAISFVVEAYKSFYETFGVHVKVQQPNEL